MPTGFFNAARTFSRPAWGIKLRSCFILFNYALGAIGLSSLTMSEIMPDPVNIALAVLLGACFVLETKRKIPIEPLAGFSLSKWGFFILPVLYFGFNLPLVELVVGFLAVLFFSRFIFKTELNDYLYGYLLAVICLLLGAIYIRDLAFAFIFLSFYLVLCWSLIFYNMMVERGGSHCPPSRFKRIGENETAGASLFGLSAGLVALSLVLTSVIFVSFPRLSLGVLALNARSSPISGFSETVTLGDVGKIKLNPEVVMRVEYRRDGKSYRPRSRILWRGVALDHYDGQSWTGTAPTEWQARNRAGVGIDLFVVDPASEMVEQEVFVESFDSDIVFTHGIPAFIDGNFRGLEMDQSFVLRLLGSPYGPKKFIIRSEIGHPDVNIDLISPGPADPEFMDRFLQLPEDLGPRIAQLAGDLARSAQTPSAKAEKILNHFAGNFQYSLDMVKETMKPGLDEFLFDRKKGHCEYFASAMVVLLRAAGVPARLVNGFAGGEWNDLGDYLIVRQSHAHSWVEAFIPGKGWAVYDPTPPDPLARATQLNNPATRALDLLRLNWQRYVIRYSVHDQVRMYNWFGRSGRDLLHKVKSLRPDAWKNAAQFLRDNRGYVLAVALTVALAALWARAPWRPGSAASRPPFAVALYAAMLRKLEKSGLRKRPNWTHREFLDHLEPLPPEKRQLVQEITGLYERLRFAGFSPSPGEKKELWKTLRRL
ncbi:MAG: DUF3488 domain-containing protein [Nitrospinae bacterium]|nr:DUF3488 domain-containing protein [Nitrospinota bacterium]